MEELILEDIDELREVVTGFLKRNMSKKTKTPRRRKKIDVTKSAERYVERLREEGKIAPDAKITIVNTEVPVTATKGTPPGLEKAMISPAVIDVYIKYLKREGHIESATKEMIGSIFDNVDLGLTPEEKEKGKEILSGLVAALLQVALSLKMELRADIRDGHIALINHAVRYARDKNISPREVFESDEHYRRFSRSRKIQHIKKMILG